MTTSAGKSITSSALLTSPQSPSSELLPVQQQHQRQQHHHNFFVIDFVAGGMSGAITKTLSAPIERIKLLMQTQRANRDVFVPYKNSIDCMHRVYREQGIRSFWRGNVAGVLRYFPSQAMNFSFKDRYQIWFLPKTTQITSFWTVFGSNLAAGGMAGGTALLASYPLDVVRTRMAADVRGGVGTGQLGVVRCIGHMWRGGGIVSFYRGLYVALTGVVVFKALYMGGYDTCKLVLGLNNRDSSIWGRLITAQAITTTAGTLCYPFDTVKRRLMVQEQQLMSVTTTTIPSEVGRDSSKSNSGVSSACDSKSSTGSGSRSNPHAAKYAAKYRNGLHCVRTILREEGIRGLYCGLPANLVRGLSGSLLLVGYDEAKILLQPLVAVVRTYQ